MKILNICIWILDLVKNYNDNDNDNDKDIDKDIDKIKIYKLAKNGLGPASSEVEHSVHKISYSGDPSSKPDSSKTSPGVFHAPISHKHDRNSSKNFTGILNLNLETNCSYLSTEWKGY